MSLSSNISETLYTYDANQKTFQSNKTLDYLTSTYKSTVDNPEAYKFYSNIYQ